MPYQTFYVSEWLRFNLFPCNLCKFIFRVWTSSKVPPDGKSHPRKQSKGCVGSEEEGASEHSLHFFFLKDIVLGSWDLGLVLFVPMVELCSGTWNITTSIRAIITNKSIVLSSHSPQLISSLATFTSFRWTAQNTWQVAFELYRIAANMNVTQHTFKIEPINFVYLQHVHMHDNMTKSLILKRLPQHHEFVSELTQITRQQISPQSKTIPFTCLKKTQ